MSTEVVASEQELQKAVEFCQLMCHSDAVNAGWWHDIVTGRPTLRNDGELIALMHSELSEALEGVRKNLMDDHLPQFRSVEVEMADVLIRIFDYAGARNLRLGEAFVEKLRYNRIRADHKPQSRASDGGKKF